MLGESPELSVDEKSMVARFGIHDEDSASISVYAFMLETGLSEVELKEALREYRSEDGWSAFEVDNVDMLSADFRNWFRWERL